MTSLEQLQQEIEHIKQRNKKVEFDKQWETSLARRLLVALLTYVVIVLFFVSSGFDKPFVNAIVPTIGFMLSTLTLGWAKKLWLKKKI